MELGNIFFKVRCYRLVLISKNLVCQGRLFYLASSFSESYHFDWNHFAENMKTIVLDRQNVESSEEKEEKKGEENGEKENPEGETDKEVLLIQDTGFNVKIAAPNLEVFELPVSQL